MNNTELIKHNKILQTENTELKKQNNALIIKINDCTSLIKQLNAKWKQKNKIIEDMQKYKIYTTQYNKITNIIKPLVIDNETVISVIHKLYKCYNKFMVALNFIKIIVKLIKENNIFTPHVISTLDIISNILNTDEPYDNILNMINNIQEIVKDNIQNTNKQNDEIVKDNIQDTNKQNDEIVKDNIQIMDKNEIMKYASQFADNKDINNMSMEYKIYFECYGYPQSIDDIDIEQFNIIKEEITKNQICKSI